MSNDAPATLTRLLDEMPVGQPPLADVLASGRAAKRRRRRVQVGTVSLVVLVVMGGSFAFSRLGTTGGDTIVADGATNGDGLNATVEVDPDALTSREPIGGEAVWDPSDGTLLYASGARYSSSCLPEPTLSNDDGSLTLELAHRAVPNRLCTSDAVPVLVTVTGLESPPERLTVSEEGTPTEVVKVTVAPSAKAVDLPANDWKPGEPGQQALLTGTLVLDENGCVALDHPLVGSRTYATWPSGYTATRDGDGLVTLRDSNGAPVARSGDTVQMGGGFHPADRIDPHPCLPQGREIASVQSEVTVVPPAQPGGSEPSPYTVYGGLSCPFSEQTRVALDIPGPGQPTPQEAVAPFLGSLFISAVHTKERAAQVIASDADGAAVTVYSLTQREDGWWPDGYTECRQ